MTTVAVVAHAKKSLGGGLPELREVLARHGVTAPLWYEVDKSRAAPKRVREAVRKGADLLFVWGGDGMVQRSLDALGDDSIPVAILPAGTANLLADNLGIPTDLAAAVETGLFGRRRTLDTGRLNGERFAVMAGVGLDAYMIRDADRVLKDRLGRFAYVLTGARQLRRPRFRARIRVDGEQWFDGDASCVLVGNVGRVFGGVDVFPAADPTDGRLEVGVVTAAGVTQWLRTLARTARGAAAASPFVELTSARKLRIDLDQAVAVELDGGTRKATKSVRLRCEPSSVVVCVPEEAR